MGEAKLVPRVPRFQCHRALLMLNRPVQITKLRPSEPEIILCFGQLWISRECVLVPLHSLLQASSPMERPAIIELGLRIRRKDFCDFCRALDRRHDSTTKLGGAKRRYRDYQNCPA